MAHDEPHFEISPESPLPTCNCMCEECTEEEIDGADNGRCWCLCKDCDPIGCGLHHETPIQ